MTPEPTPLEIKGLTLSMLAAEFGLELKGEDGPVSHLTLVNGPSQGPGGLTYIASDSYLDAFIHGTHDAAVLDQRLWGGKELAGKSVLLAAAHQAEEDFFRIQVDVHSKDRVAGVDPHRGVGVEISQGAVVMDPVQIGDHARIGPGAVILPNSVIGSHVVIKANATVGGDGFEVKVLDGRRRAIPHTGGVFIGDDSLIGSSTCIDRGLFNSYTVLGRGTMVDNLVHIAHNVRIGDGSVVVAGAEVSGSAVLGSGVWYGPQASCNPEVTLGDYAFVGTGSVVVRDVPAFTLVAGVPARPLGVVCRCRSRLEMSADVVVCDRCGATISRDAESGELALTGDR